MKFPSFEVMKKGFTVLSIIVPLLTIPSTFYFYMKFEQAQKLIDNPSLITQQDLKMVEDKVGQFMILPTNEEPVLATVSDASKMSGQPFFANAQNGDKLLIYKNSKKAILYRPSINKIVEASFNIDAGLPTSDGDVAGASTVNVTPTPTSSPDASVQSLTRVVLYNGTTATSAASVVEKNIESKVNNVTVPIIGTALRNDYDRTQVVDLGTNHLDTAKQIALVLNAELTQMPQDEVKPADADVLIIVGRDAIEQ